MKDRSTVKYICSLLLLQTALLLVSMAGGYRGVSGDDFFRALMAFEWAREPYLVSKGFENCSILWFPTHFWLGGFIQKITGQIVPSMVGLSFFFCLIQSVLLYLLAKTLFDRKSAVFCLILVLFFSWNIRAGTSMAELTPYFCALIGAFLCYVLWLRNMATRFLLAAGACLMIATAFRPESWLFVPLFSIALLAKWHKDRGGVKSLFNIAFSVGISCLFIVFWLGYNSFEYGNPFFFITFNKSFIQARMFMETVPVAVKAMKYPALMIIVAPILFLAAFAAIAARLKSFDGIQKGFLFLVFSHLSLMICASVYGVGTEAAPQRYVLIYALLLTPFAGFGLGQVWSGKFKIAVIVLLMFFIGFHGFKTFFFISRYNHAIQVGNYFNGRFSSPGEKIPGKIAMDTDFRIITGEIFETEAQFLEISTSHAAATVFSENPDWFMSNILKIKERELFAMTPSEMPTNAKRGSDEIDRQLKANDVRYIALQERGLMEKIPERFVPMQIVGNHVVFSDIKFHGASLSSFFEPRLEKTGMNRLMAEGIRLVHVETRGVFFSDTILLTWKLDPKAASYGKYNLTLFFRNSIDPNLGFEQNAVPVFQWMKPSSIKEPLFIRELIPISLPPHLPCGKYEIAMDLQPNPTQRAGVEPDLPDKTKTPVQLVTANLLTTKRKAVIDFIQGKLTDIFTLFKVLLLL